MSAPDGKHVEGSIVSAEGLAKEATAFLTKALQAIVEIETEEVPDEHTIARCRQAIGQAQLDLRCLRRELKSARKGLSSPTGEREAEAKAAEPPTESVQ